MKRIQKGDEVVVIAGRDKDLSRPAKVLEVRGDRVIVEGVNQVSKHVKPNPQLGIEGGIVKKNASIHISNVMLYNPETGKGDRVGFKVEGDSKYRYFKSTGNKVS